jgi:hypothetical protein
MASLFIIDIPSGIDQHKLNDKLKTKFSRYGSCSTRVSTRKNKCDALIEFSYSHEAKKAYEALNEMEISVGIHTWNLKITDMIDSLKIKNKTKTKDTKKSELNVSKSEKKIDDKINENQTSRTDRDFLGKKTELSDKPIRYFAKRSREVEKELTRKPAKTIISEACNLNNEIKNAMEPISKKINSNIIEDKSLVEKQINEIEEEDFKQDYSEKEVHLDDFE